MQPHTELIVLVELHRRSLLAEAAREREAHAVERERRPGPRAFLASALVAVALWLDRQEAVAGLDPALGRARHLQGHA
jgi:hypothetical protein